MKTYVVKVSPQSQITLPKKLREELNIRPGRSVTLRAVNGAVQVDGKLPIEKYFGKFPGITGGRDAAEYIRGMRDRQNRKTMARFGR